MTNVLALAAALAATNGPVIVVEASRIGAAAGEIPSRVETISRDEAESSGARSFVDLLERRANVFVRRMNANPAQAQVSMRGYGANGFARTKIVVDGESLNNADMSPQGLMRVPVEGVRRVEILHGPQTVLHGGDASAGVVNVVTDGDSFERRTELEAHGGSWDSFGAHVGTRGGFEPEGVTYFASADWDRSGGWRDNTQWEIWSAKGGVKKAWENGSWVRVRAFWADSRYGLPGGLYDGVAFGVDYGRWQDRARTADDGDSEARDVVYGGTLDGSFSLADERRLETSYSVRHRRSSGYSDYDVYDHDVSLKFVDDGRLGGFDNSFALGSDLGLDDVRAVSSAKNSYSRFDGALFARDEFWLVEDELAFVAGVRGEGFASRDKLRRTAADGVESRSFGRAAGEAGMNWLPADGVKAFARWTRFYHAPLADELFSAYGVPNMDLAPEVGQNLEVGADWTFAEEWNAEATLFHSALKDEITYLNYANCNAPDDTRRDGVEASFGWRREKTGAARVQYAFTDASFAHGELKGEYVPLVPRQLVRMFGEWFLRDDFAVNGGCRFVGRQRHGGDWRGEGGMMPGFCVFDLGARWTPECWRLKGFAFSFAVANLFDRRYADYGEWFGARYVYPAAGRCFTFGVRYEF